MDSVTYVQFAKAIEVFGIDAQINMAIEELSELITALSHYKRSDLNRVESELAVIDEIADVSIMIAQLDIIFDHQLFILN